MLPTDQSFCVVYQQNTFPNKVEVEVIWSISQKTDIEQTRERVRLVEDVINLEIVRKRPFKHSKKTISSRNFAQL